MRTHIDAIGRIYKTASMICNQTLNATNYTYN